MIPCRVRAFRSALDPGLSEFPSDVLVLAVVVDVLRATTTLVHAFAHGARSARELYYVDTFERLGVRPVLATEDGTRGVRGLITAPLGDAFRSLSPGSTVQLYVCGPTPMMRAVARLAETSGRGCDVSLEQVMGCGLGGCYSCVVLAKDTAGRAHFVRSCLDGPVFDSRRVVWEALVH